MKVIIFLIVVPGTVTVLVPYLIVSSESGGPWFNADVFRYLGIIPIVLGGIVALRCIWDFFTLGRGTPAPIDPPKELVVAGFYRYVRNPMYIGVFSVLLGETVFFGARRLLEFALAFAVVVHLFVVLYEEPTLLRKFGASYVQYCKRVSRWIPHFKPSLQNPER